MSVTGAPAEIAVLADQIDGMRSRILHEYALAEASRREALEARQLVEEQAEDLRRSNTELEQFAYVASHDLQEPLRKVASFCQLLEHRYEGQLDERGEQYIEFAVDGAKRMQQLINDLLAFSRVGRSGSGFAPVDLEGVLAQAERQLELMIAEADAVVTHDPLPTIEGDAQPARPAVAEPDRQRGEVPRRTSPPRVHVGAARSAGDPNVWEFSCSDNGIGIDAGVRRQDLRDLPAAARPGRLRRHRHRAGDVQEDRGVPRRPDLARHRAARGARGRLPLDPAGAPARRAAAERPRRPTAAPTAARWHDDAAGTTRDEDEQ